MQKVRESLLKMSVFNVANMVTGKYKYSVCLLYEFCLSLQPFHHLSLFSQWCPDTSHFDILTSHFHQDILHKDFNESFLCLKQ